MVKKSGKKLSKNSSTGSLRARARSTGRGANTSEAITYKQKQDQHITVQEAMSQYGKSGSTIRRWYRDPDINVDVFRNLVDPNDIRNFVDPVQIQRMCAKSQRSSMSEGSRIDSLRTRSEPVFYQDRDLPPIQNPQTQVLLLTKDIENKENLLEEQEKRISLLTRQNGKLEEEISRLHDHHDSILKYLNRMSLTGKVEPSADESGEEEPALETRSIPMPPLPSPEEIEPPSGPVEQSQITIEDVQRASSDAAEKVAERVMAEARTDRDRLQKLEEDLRRRNEELKRKRQKRFPLSPIGAAEKVAEGIRDRLGL